MITSNDEALASLKSQSVESNTRRIEEGIITDAMDKPENASTTGADENIHDGDGDDDDPPPSEQSKQPFYMSTKLWVGLAFFALIAFIIVDSATNMHALHAIEAFLDWVEDNPVGGVFGFVGGRFLFNSLHAYFIIATHPFDFQTVSCCLSLLCCNDPILSWGYFDTWRGVRFCRGLWVGRRRGLGNLGGLYWSCSGRHGCLPAESLPLATTNAKADAQVPHL